MAMRVILLVAAALLTGHSAVSAEQPKLGKRSWLIGGEITYAVGQYGCGVALTDWDGDGFTDIIGANGDGEVFVVPFAPGGIGLIDDPRRELRLLQDTLIGKIPSKYPGADPVILEVADKNGDGKEDLVLRDRFGRDWLLLRTDRIKLGEAKALGELHKDWKRPAEYPIARGKMIEPSGTREMDLTGRPGSFKVHWAGEPDSGRMGSWGFAWHGRDGYDPNFDVVDLDGDGHKDIVTVAVARTPGRAARTVLLHRGGRNRKLRQVFDPGQEIFDGAQVHNVIAAGDLDGDGRVDLTLSRMGFHVLWNEGTKTEPKFTKKSKVDGVEDEESVSLVDWDGDGLLDIVSSRWHGADHAAHVSFYRNLGKKAPEIAFDKPQDILVNGKPVSMSTAGMCVVDFDGDGDIDLVFCPYGGAVAWAENTVGKGKPPIFAALKPVVCEEGPVKFGSRNSAIRVVDIDGDGKFDLLTSTEYGGFDVNMEVCVWYGK